MEKITIINTIQFVVAAIIYSKDTRHIYICQNGEFCLKEKPFLVNSWLKITDIYTKNHFRENMHNSDIFYVA